MFKAAAVLNAQGELSRMFRLAGIREGSLLAGTPNLFLNTHPVELTEPELLELSLRELRDMRPSGAITLEIHETAVTEPAQMRQLRTVLGELNVELAYDDFGAGQARLVELSEVPPDYLKFDAKLIRDIQQAPSHRQKLLESLLRMALDLGIVPLAEGVESLEEHETCTQLGFFLGQGFFYGKPAAVKHHTSSKHAS
jgi:EAL domain-containing protein (putative c-di-GMP-specific phosphodiesterase class I)